MHTTPEPQPTFYTNAFRYRVQLQQGSRQQLQQQKGLQDTFLIHVNYEASYEDDGWDRLDVGLHGVLFGRLPVRADGQAWKGHTQGLFQGHAHTLSSFMACRATHGAPRTRHASSKPTAPALALPIPLQLAVNEVVPIPDQIKAHAAGFAEAFFTWERIWRYWSNYKANEFARSGGEPSPKLVAFIRQQAAYVRVRPLHALGDN